MIPSISVSTPKKYFQNNYTENNKHINSVDRNRKLDIKTIRINDSQKYLDENLFSNVSSHSQDYNFEDDLTQIKSKSPKQ